MPFRMNGFSLFNGKEALLLNRTLLRPPFLRSTDGRRFVM